MDEGLPSSAQLRRLSGGMILLTAGQTLLAQGHAFVMALRPLDFTLWGLPSEAARQAFSSQVLQAPAISLPFVSVGPSLLFVGLGTMVLEWVAAMRWRVGLVLGGIALVGVGQFGNARWLVVGGHLIILAGLGTMWLRVLTWKT